MKLYDVLPNSVEYNGQTFKLNLSFANVLEVADVIKSANLTDDDKLDYCLYLFFCENEEYPIEIGLLNKVFEMIDSGEEKQEKAAVMDFSQDADFIYAAFKQVYGIDLLDTPLHWFKFIALLKGLPDGTRLAEIIKIRTMPIPNPNKYNAKDREELIKLKREYAIKTTAKQREEQYKKGLFDMFMSLKAMADGGNNGKN